MSGPMRDLATTLSTDERRALSRWRARVRLGLLVGGLADGLAATALAVVALLLALRLFGVAPAPHPWWLLALALPVATAVLRLVRGDRSFADAALHLDRRLGLGGLLLSGLECDVSAWRSRLTVGLHDLAAGLPRVRYGRALARAALPLAALSGVLLLPPPSADPREADPAITRALERFESRLKEIARHEGLKEEARREISERVEALKERRQKGEAVSWADIDSAEERMDREARRRAADLAISKAEATAFSREEHADPAAAQAEMASLLTDAEKAGLRDDLPNDLALKAGLTADGKIDPKSMSADAATLHAIAKAMAGTAGERLDALSQLGVVDLADVEALERLLEGDPAALSGEEEGEACSDCHGERPEACDG